MHYLFFSFFFFLNASLNNFTPALTFMPPVKFVSNCFTILVYFPKTFTSLTYLYKKMHIITLVTRYYLHLFFFNPKVKE